SIFSLYYAPTAAGPATLDPTTASLLAAASNPSLVAATNAAYYAQAVMAAARNNAAAAAAVGQSAALNPGASLTDPYLGAALAPLAGYPATAALYRTINRFTPY
uniref:Uncharacterized protein n=1 Tax=Romanomermis culicivorax TaxID=13658 RepID=A0A915KEZ0_ROMCU